MLVEAKKNSAASTREHVRAALGQLLEYAWWWKETGGPTASVLLWVALKTRPTKDIIRFLRDHKILVSWLKAGKLAFAEGDMRRLTRLAKTGVYQW